MKIKLTHAFLFVSLLMVAACSSDDSQEIDEEKPTISVNYDNGFPQGCAELIKGGTFNFRAMVADNQALASFSIDIHHNFDHHTHDDQIAECDLNPKKEAVNPMIFIENYAIEGNLQTYEINVPIDIPSDIDLGDYHCSFSVTDQTGWYARTSVDMKIVE